MLLFEFEEEIFRDFTTVADTATMIESPIHSLSDKARTPVHSLSDKARRRIAHVAPRGVCCYGVQ
jgi:hypothetical protein